MMLVCSDPGAAWESDHKRHGHETPGAITKTAEMADDLIERGIDKTVELDLGNGTGAGYGHTDRGADDSRFVERSLDHPVFPESLKQTLRDAEDTARHRDILSQDDRLRPGFHRLGDGGVDGFGHGPTSGPTGRESDPIVQISSASNDVGCSQAALWAS
jgi:hypothetical protein